MRYRSSPGGTRESEYLELHRNAPQCWGTRGCAVIMGFVLLSIMPASPILCVVIYCHQGRWPWPIYRPPPPLVSHNVVCTLAHRTFWLQGVDIKVPSCNLFFLFFQLDTLRFCSRRVLLLFTVYFRLCFGMRATVLRPAQLVRFVL